MRITFAFHLAFVDVVLAEFTSIPQSTLALELWAVVRAEFLSLFAYAPFQHTRFRCSDKGTLRSGRPSVGTLHRGILERIDIGIRPLRHGT